MNCEIDEAIDGGPLELVVLLYFDTSVLEIDEDHDGDQLNIEFQRNLKRWQRSRDYRQIPDT